MGVVEQLIDEGLYECGERVGAGWKGWKRDGFGDGEIMCDGCLTDGSP